jgi:hypothetical protein
MGRVRVRSSRSYAPQLGRLPRTFVDGKFHMLHWASLLIYLYYELRGPSATVSSGADDLSAMLQSYFLGFTTAVGVAVGASAGVGVAPGDVGLLPI